MTESTIDVDIERLVSDMIVLGAIHWPLFGTTLRSSSRLGDYDSGPMLELLQRWRTHIANVAATGPISAGKTTAINGVIGIDLLPTATKATTAVPAVVRYGAAFQAKALVRVEDEAGLTEIPVERDALWSILTTNAALSLRRRFGKRAVVKSVEIEVPSDELVGGLCMLDTPGASGIVNSHIDAARRMLPIADALMFMFTPGAPPSRADRAFLAEAAGRVPEILLVYSHGDSSATPDAIADAARSLREPDEWAKITDDRQQAEGLAYRFREPPVVISAQAWIAAKGLPEPGRMYAEAASGFQTLLNWLHDVVSRTDDLHRRRIVLHLRDDLYAIVAEVDHNLGLLDDSDSARREQARREYAAESWRKNGGDRWRSAIREARDGLDSKFQELSDRRSRDLGARWDGKFDNMKAKQIMSTCEDLSDEPGYLLRDLFEEAGKALDAELLALSKLAEAELGDAFRLAAMEQAEDVDRVSFKPDPAHLSWTDVLSGAGGYTFAAMMGAVAGGGAAPWLVVAANPFAWPLLLGAALFGGAVWYRRAKAQRVRDARDHLGRIREVLRTDVVRAAKKAADGALEVLMTQLEQRFDRTADRIRETGAQSRDEFAKGSEADRSAYREKLTAIHDQAEPILAAANELLRRLDRAEGNAAA